ncbi:Uncharacterised protein [Candidatus Tiddalikarchaeum anstoanum]|nr:Uncharacterised protein [Candidatus Tiddalikarchaeum anstoanum]
MDSKTIRMILLFVFYFILIIIPFGIDGWTGGTTTNFVLMNAAFFTLIGCVIFAIGGFLLAGFKTAKLEGDATIPSGTQTVKIKTLGSGLSPQIIMYNLGRVLAIATFLLIQSWIFLVSPFSLMGGSLYGFFMQIIIMVPLFFIMLNFWTSGNTTGLFIIVAANILLLPLSFSFPTLFSNLYVLSTGTSAAAGGAAGASFAVINPMSYYRSAVLKAGQTEPVVGPTYEEISDDVIGVDVAVSGRLCDDSDIIVTARLDNQAKYALRDVFVKFSPILDVYTRRDFCSTHYRPNSTSQPTDTYFSVKIDTIAKGAPASRQAGFRTHLPADVLSQICTMRTDIILNYHSTAVFPLTFVNYDYYQLSPENLGTPVSTSSFGKVRIDMGVGQQPVPVRNDSVSNLLMLKIGWAPKTDALTSNPKLFLFLPKDLGFCVPANLVGLGLTNGSAAGLGIPYYGTLVSNRSRVNAENFKCYSNSNPGDSGDPCSIFKSNTTLNAILQDPLMALSNTSLPTSSSIGVPGTDLVCNELVKKLGYTVCESTFSPSPNDLLICMLDLNYRTDGTTLGQKIADATTNTYLIRADAVYDFHAVTTTTYNIENCDAI